MDKWDCQLTQSLRNIQEIFHSTQMYSVTTTTFKKYVLEMLLELIGDLTSVCVSLKTLIIVPSKVSLISIKLK